MELTSYQMGELQDIDAFQSFINEDELETVMSNF
jgi:hypothetical protein